MDTLRLILICMCLFGSQLEAEGAPHQASDGDLLSDLEALVEVNQLMRRGNSQKLQEQIIWAKLNMMNEGISPRARSILTKIIALEDMIKGAMVNQYACNEEDFAKLSEVTKAMKGYLVSDIIYLPDRADQISMIRWMIRSFENDYATRCFQIFESMSRGFNKPAARRLSKLKMLMPKMTMKQRNEVPYPIVSPTLERLDYVVHGRHKSYLDWYSVMTIKFNVGPSSSKAEQLKELADKFIHKACEKVEGQRYMSQTLELVYELAKSIDLRVINHVDESGGNCLDLAAYYQICKLEVHAQRRNS